MYKECEICTGCGRCAKQETAIHIVTESFLGQYAENGVCCQDTDIVIADIGTTTVAMQLLGRDGKIIDSFMKVNPQVKYGADVLSRILAAENQETAEQMRQLIREVISEGLCRFRNLMSDGNKMQMMLAGNTVMIYLLMGYDPAELGKAPFCATHLKGFHTEFDGVSCYVFPGISAFVGGDIVAGAFATGMFEKEEISLLIDLGTNGELVLGNRKTRVSCSTAAGPAFEGGASKGIWGADMVSLVARLLREAVVDETGLLQEPFFDEGIKIGGVLVTQQAIRQLQLAKAAIATGITLLIKEYGISTQQIDKVILAGGLGYYIRPEDAMEIGLLPKELLGKAVAGGNTALAGAGKLAFCREKIDMLQGAASDTKSVSIAEKAEFQEMFIQRMNLEFLET